MRRLAFEDKQLAPSFAREVVVSGKCSFLELFSYTMLHFHCAERTDRFGNLTSLLDIGIRPILKQFVCVHGWLNIIKQQPPQLQCVKYFIEDFSHSVYS